MSWAVATLVVLEAKGSNPARNWSLITVLFATTYFRLLRKQTNKVSTPALTATATAADAAVEEEEQQQQHKQQQQKDKKEEQKEKVQGE